MKKKFIIIGVVIAFLVIFFLVYPTVEFQVPSKSQLIAFRYSDDISEFETELSLDENYTYYEKRDISIRSFEFKKFLLFHVLVMEYVEGNYCDTEFLLEESYIQDFLERGEIQLNESSLDIAMLIEGKEAIVGNTRYFGNEYDKSIDYELDGEYETLYVFYQDDLLVIQVGSPDEGPRYIAYK